MSLDRLFGVASALVTVALVTTIVSHKDSAGIVKALGDAFTGALRAAQGK
jgi:Flp pilus assembly pilin Flp